MNTTLEQRITTLENEVAELREIYGLPPDRQAYIKELARQIAMGNRQALREHNRREKERMGRS